MTGSGGSTAAPHAYLDHASSSPMRPEAVDALVDATERLFANPSGSHRWARAARRALDDARDVVAELVGAHPSEVVFTSGGTEADNAALRGLVAALGGAPVCSAVEHHAVLDTVCALGGEVVAVEPTGRVDLGALRRALEHRQASGRGAVPVVSVMLANNETGVVNDLEAVAGVLREVAPEVRLHTDAVAAAPWLDLVGATRPAHLVSVSAHKLGGPKGMGALVVRDGTPLEPILTGGGQERERRSGTPDVAGAVAFAAAFAAAVREREATVARVRALRDRLRDGLRAAVPDLVETASASPDSHRTAGTLHVCIPGVERESLLFLLDEAGVAASWGSSCTSGASEPSHVLAAMGVPEHLARGALRLSLGWSTTDAEVDHAVEVVPAAVERLRRAAA